MKTHYLLFLVHNLRIQGGKTKCCKLQNCTYSTWIFVGIINNRAKGTEKRKKEKSLKSKLWLLNSYEGIKVTFYGA